MKTTESATEFIQRHNSTESFMWVVFINDTHIIDNQLCIFSLEDYPTIEELILELEYEDYNETQKLTDRILLDLNSIVLTNDKSWSFSKN